MSTDAASSGRKCQAGDRKGENLRARTAGLHALLDGIEQGNSSWTEFLGQLEDLERSVRNLDLSTRDSFLAQIQHAEHFAERGHLATARACVKRAEQFIP